MSTKWAAPTSSGPGGTRTDGPGPVVQPSGLETVAQGLVSRLRAARTGISHASPFSIPYTCAAASSISLYLFRRFLDVAAGERALVTLALSPPPEVPLPVLRQAIFLERAVLLFCGGSAPTPNTPLAKIHLFSLTSFFAFSRSCLFRSTVRGQRIPPRIAVHEFPLHSTLCDRKTSAAAQRKDFREYRQFCPGRSHTRHRIRPDMRRRTMAHSATLDGLITRRRGGREA